MFNFNNINKDVCPCLSCEHSNVCMYREKFTLYYDKVNSENRDGNIPECATLSVSCKYACFSSLSATYVSRSSNVIQGVVDKAATLSTTTTETPCTIATGF